MKSLQRLVVAALLAVWCFPAVSLAAPPPPAAAVDVGSRGASGASPAPSSAQTEASELATREKQAQDLQNFKGGGVYVYLGGGATLILVLARSVPAVRGAGGRGGGWFPPLPPRASLLAPGRLCLSPPPPPPPATC